uniref:Uncharacterized protein n=1 Tax=Vombatus ursinus TaxID=29139 RepID=A0A4X2JSA0_VOMUR
MQSLSSICKKLGRSSRFFVELAPSVGFSISCYLCKVKQNKYSNLIYSIVSTKISSQIPESLFQEDDLLHGPMSKCTAQEQESGPIVTQNTILLLNAEKRNESNTLTHSTVPLKILLQKNKMLSVTRILQQTMTAKQILNLERWKQSMILELGGDDFAENTSDIFLQIPCSHTFHGLRALFPILVQMAASTRKIYRKRKEPNYFKSSVGYRILSKASLPFITVWGKGCFRNLVNP